MPRYLPAALLLALAPSAAFAQRDAKIPDPDPELERKTFIVAPGFEVSLYAADPLLAKPIQMNFDPQGRLWVASSEVYPQIKPGETANDKIIVLEDTDGDGKADKTTVFADGLLIPTGIEPGNGGAYVANSTELVHLSASKPGGKADRTKVLLSGFGTEDTHHIIHTFRWGPDSRLYFNQSIYIHSHIETPTGVKRLNAGGIWRFDPDRTELDVFARGWVNSWGHAFDRWGQSFATDGAGGEGINHVVPGGYYLTSQGPHVQRLLHGLNPGSPKLCGLEIVSGRHFPDDWQGDCITNDFRGHRVCRFKLSDDGSSYASREQVEVIKSNHPAFRPIDVKLGPDGALYIADWYNPIIQHGEVDFRDPRRDKTHGRIWRVTAKGRPLVPKPKLVDATVPELLEHLKAPEGWTRQQAKRVLKERGAKAVVAELEQWVSKLPPEDPHPRLEALWVFEALNLPAPALIADALKSAAPGARAAGLRAVSNLAGKGAGVPASVTAGAEDPHPRVRLEAVRTAVQFPSPAAAESALGALGQPMDRTLDYALWLTVRELEPYWMPEFKAGRLTFGGDAKKLAFALNAVGTADAVKPVVQLLESGKVAKDQQHGLWLLLAQIGGPQEMVLVIAHAGRDPAVTPAQRDELLEGVEAGVRTRKVEPPKPPDLVVKDWAENSAARRAVMRLCGLWKVEEASLALMEIAVFDTTTPADRRAALEGLVRAGGVWRDATFRKLMEEKMPAAFQRDAIVAFAGVRTDATAAKAAEILADATPTDDLIDVYATFLSRKGGATALAKALVGKKLPPDVAKLGLRAVRASLAQDAAPLTDALTKAGGLGAARKEPTPAEVKELVAEALEKGDPARGEAVFRRKDLQCLACHGIGGAGGQVGPDMTSIGASAQPDYIVESLLIPNKAVKEGFHAMRVVTADDKVVLGIKVRETKDQLVLRTPEDKEVVIPPKDVIEKGNTRSLMPDGLVDTLTKGEFADLVRFLSELGKVGPYAPSKDRIVRRWQLIEPTAENMNLFRRNRVSAAGEPDVPFVWAPAYSVVSGELPLADLPKYSVWQDTAPLTVVRCQLDGTAAGPVKLKLNSAAGVALYAGRDPVEAKVETALDLKPGVQALTFVIDRTKRTGGLRVELQDVPGSPARVAVVGGK